MLGTEIFATVYINVWILAGSQVSTQSARFKISIFCIFNSVYVQSKRASAKNCVLSLFYSASSPNMFFLKKLCIMFDSACSCLKNKMVEWSNYQIEMRQRSIFNIFQFSEAWKHLRDFLPAWRSIHYSRCENVYWRHRFTILRRARPPSHWMHVYVWNGPSSLNKPRALEGMLSTYAKVVNYLFQTYVTDDDIAETDSALTRYIKPATILPMQNAVVLVYKSLRCEEV